MIIILLNMEVEDLIIIIYRNNENVYDFEVSHGIQINVLK